MIEANKTYDVTVTGAEWIRSGKGTVGLHLDLEEAVEGWMPYTIWISHAAREMARKQLKALGCADALQTEDGIASLPERVVGKATKVITYEDLYNGEARIKVKSIVTGPAPATDVDFGKLAAILADEPQPEPIETAAAQGPGLFGPGDDEIPF